MKLYICQYVQTIYFAHSLDCFVVLMYLVLCCLQSFGCKYVYASVNASVSMKIDSKYENVHMLLGYYVNCSGCIYVSRY